MLYLVRMRREEEDKLWWVPSKRGLLSVKSFYKVIGCHDGVRFPLKSVWRTTIPLRVAFFCVVDNSKRDRNNGQPSKRVCHRG
jgi:hypothetical protein